MGIFTKTKPKSKRDKKGRFVKGSVWNPKGRPKKGEAFTDALREHINKDELAKKLSELIDKKNLAAIKYTYDRLDGRPTEKIEQTGEMKHTIKTSPEIVEMVQKIVNGS